MKSFDEQISESIIHFKETGKVLNPELYKGLYSRKLLPKHTAEFREKIKNRASEMLRSKEKGSCYLDDFKNFERMIKEEKTITAYLKKVVLIEYFESVTKQ